MGLAICVGGLADTKDDPETHDSVLQRFVSINNALRRAGRPPHVEPDVPLVWSYGTGYRTLHYLRRVAAHLWANDRLPAPCGAEENPVDDPVARRYGAFWGTGPGGLFSGLGRLFRKPKRTFEHLMLHSDAEGVYLPQDFTSVILDDVPGGVIGSSFRLKEECEALAARLELPLDVDPESVDDESEWRSRIPAGSTPDRFSTEAAICLALHHAADHSIRSGAAVSFG